MRTRNLMFILAAITIVILMMLASQSSVHRSEAAAQAGTMEPTAVDVGAACEVLRTTPKVVATLAPGATPAAVPRPSNAGGPNLAVLKLKGDPQAGLKVYTDNCQKCHADQGVGGIKNPGSDDGTIPALNPIDENLVDPDMAVFACNLDLFLEHGSVPSGPSPQQTMQPWGDNQQLQPQQIADVITYLITLNSTATATPAK